MKRYADRMMTVAAAALLGALCLAAGVPRAYAAAAPTNEQVLVEQAQIAFREFHGSPVMGAFRDALKSARGVLIVPTMYKGGLIFGGSGGKGVYLTKDAKTGAWKGPAFYNMGSFTYGLQIGGEVSQVIILAMTDDAVKSMLSPQFKLGADASVAAGPVGGGASGGASLPVAAFLSFARSKGAFAGLTLEGAVVKSDGDADAAYYGRRLTPDDILMGGAGSSKASGLRQDVTNAAAGRKCG